MEWWWFDSIDRFSLTSRCKASKRIAVSAPVPWCVLWRNNDGVTDIKRLQSTNFSFLSCLHVVYTFSTTGSKSLIEVHHYSGSTTGNNNNMALLCYLLNCHHKPIFSLQYVHFSTLFHSLNYSLSVISINQKSINQYNNSFINSNRSINPSWLLNNNNNNS